MGWGKTLATAAVGRRAGHGHRGADKEEKAEAWSPSRRLNGSVAEGCDRQPKARAQAFGTSVTFNLAAQLLHRGVDQPHAIPVCTEIPIRVDDLTESPKTGGMIRLLCFGRLASPFKSKLPLEAENAVLRRWFCRWPFAGPQVCRTTVIFEGVARHFRHLPLQCIAVGIGGDGGLRAVLYEAGSAMLVNRGI
jgi:hypothetical protein